MLVLTRKLQQQIKIGENVTITILRVKGAAVQIGIDAPKDVRILRKELPANASPIAAASDELPLLSVHEGDESEPAMSTPDREAIVRTEFPADKSQLKAAQLPGRKNARFNMPPLKLSVSIPTLAK